MSEAGELIQLGEVCRPRGIRGEVKVRPSADPERSFQDMQEVFILGQEKRGPLLIENCRLQGEYVLLKFKGFNTPQSVDFLRQCALAVPYSKLVNLDEDEYYFCDLLDCQVVMESGETLGVVTDYAPTNEHDLLIVRDGKKERFIPVQKDIILHINKDEKRIIVAWNGEGVTDE
jgi:16S rRNA processing protein RimM